MRLCVCFASFATMSRIVWLALALAIGLQMNAAPTNTRLSDDEPLLLPPVGSYQLRILTPTLLELALVTTKAPDPAPTVEWGFVDPNGQAQLPSASYFQVLAGGHAVSVQTVGFKRRVIYA